MPRLCSVCATRLNGDARSDAVCSDAEADEGLAGTLPAGVGSRKLLGLVVESEPPASPECEVPKCAGDPESKLGRDENRGIISCPLPCCATPRSRSRAGRPFQLVESLALAEPRPGADPAAAEGSGASAAGSNVKLCRRPESASAHEACERLPSAACLPPVRCAVLLEALPAVAGALDRGVLCADPPPPVPPEPLLFLLRPERSFRSLKDGQSCDTTESVSPSALSARL